MLDLILFTSCFGVTKYISRQEHFTLQQRAAPKPSSADGVGNIRKSPSDHQVESYSSSSVKPEDPSKHSTSILYRASRVIFQITLLLSLWLFCLSILEAAPSSWLLIIHQTSSFVQCYRLNLWALCILLEVAMPTFVGVMLVVKLSGYEALTLRHSSDAASPSKSIKSPTNKSGGRCENHRVFLMFQLLWISVRFCLAATWYILKKIVSIFLPSTRTTTTNPRGTLKSSREFCIENNRLKQYCSLRVVLPVLFALSVSFWMLVTLSSIVISSDTMTYDEGDSTATIIEHKHSIGKYCLWIVGPHSPLKFMVKMACALGMICASVLNGFGCASMPHANLVGMYLKPTSAAVLAKVEEDYFYAAQNLEEKKYMLSGLLQVSSSANVPADNIKINQLREEIGFLENLVGDMGDDIDEMKHSQKLAMEARTTVGRISWVLGMIFSVILVVRVLLAASSFMHVSRTDHSDLEASPSKSRQRRDPITMIFLWLTGHHIVSDEQYNLYLQGTSLILAGLLTVSQVRNFFRVIGALGRKLSKILGVSIDTSTSQHQRMKAMGDLSLLLSSFVMGCYFLSCVVVVKMTLPLEYRSSFSAAVGKFDFGFNSAVLNMVFCVSTCTSAIILGFLFGIQRNNSERYNVESTITSKGSFSQDAATHTA